MPTKPAAKPRNYVAAMVVIACLATGLALAAGALPGISWPIHRLDDVLYDALYRQRPAESMQNSDVVIVAVDDASLTAISNERKFGWPWPRDFWAVMLPYFKQCGAKAVVFDLLFSERSAHAQDAGDDDTFGQALDDAPLPVVLATNPDSQGRPGPFAPAVTKPPLFGAVDINNPRSDVVFREYQPIVNGMPSLALKAVQAIGEHPREAEQPFLLHYYGPNKLPDGHTTFRYIKAGSVIGVATDPAHASAYQLQPADFAGKIVLIGAIAAGTYDEKSTPLSADYPGVEIHATAIENLLHDQRVRPVPYWAMALFAWFLATWCAFGTVAVRRVGGKLGWIVIPLIIWAITAKGLFESHVIRWMPLAVPLLAILLATLGGFAWSFLGEDRQRRRLLKALSSVVSPHIAEELAADPRKLAVSARRQSMTAMFTDVAGFTDISEALGVEELSKLLSFYLEQMSAVVLTTDGTLDKYVGDAIVSFWNAPLPQADHALRACRAALGLAQREREIQPQLQQMAGRPFFTRIGVNTGFMAVGFTGSSRLLNYTVLGDAVNLASRLEGANKFYHSQILISHETAEQVKSHFILRKLDVLRVKGKQEPMAVYELLMECPPRDCPPELRHRIERYVQAFAAYQKQNWAEAEKLLLELKQDLQEDGPTEALLERVRAYQQDPPPIGWDGVHTARQK